MKKLNTTNLKLFGRAYIVKRVSSLFRRAKYSVIISSGRIRLTRLVRQTNLTNGLQGKQKTVCRTGPNGHQYVFISARKFRN